MSKQGALRASAAVWLCLTACSGGEGSTASTNAVPSVAGPSRMTPGMTAPLSPMAGAAGDAASGMTAVPASDVGGSNAPMTSGTAGGMAPMVSPSGRPVGMGQDGDSVGAVDSSATPTGAATPGPMTLPGDTGATGTTGAGSDTGVDSDADPKGAQGDGGFIREADPTEASITAPGEFRVESYTEFDGLVGGTAYGAAAIFGDGSQLYYPADAEAPFASMVVVPGFTAQRSDVAPWGAFLASHGIVTLVIDTNNTGDQPATRSLALLDGIESLKKENSRSGSPVEGKLDMSRMGVMGWSMGGGGTWITADAHPELKVAVSLCGWIIGFQGLTTTVPSLQLAVRDDSLAAGMSQPVYQAIPETTPKMILEFASGGHWINNNPANKANLVGYYGLSWIKVFLEGDERYRQFFKNEPVGASDFRTNQ